MLVDINEAAGFCTTCEHPVGIAGSSQADGIAALGADQPASSSEDRSHDMTAASASALRLPITRPQRSDRSLQVSPSPLPNEEPLVDGVTMVGNGEGGLNANLTDTTDVFGSSMTNIYDIDGNGVPDIAVGAPADDSDDGEDTGTIWVLRMQQGGTVLGATKISSTDDGIPFARSPYDAIGTSLSALLQPMGDQPDMVRLVAGCQ